jgi:hypothetical protein
MRGGMPSAMQRPIGLQGLFEDPSRRGRRSHPIRQQWVQDVGAAPSQRCGGPSVCRASSKTHRAEGGAPTPSGSNGYRMWELRPQSDAAAHRSAGALRRPIAPRAALPPHLAAMGTGCGSCALAAMQQPIGLQGLFEDPSRRGRRSHPIRQQWVQDVGAAPSQRCGGQ